LGDKKTLQLFIEKNSVKVISHILETGEERTKELEDKNYINYPECTSETVGEGKRDWNAK
jgi:hypothetical protein